MPPLGDDIVPEGGGLVVNKDEATTVESIFRLYLEMHTLLAVVQKLRRSPIRRKTWTTRDGKTRVGREFNNVDVHRLFTDPMAECFATTTEKRRSFSAASLGRVARRQARCPHGYVRVLTSVI